jgi:hypothetical protein
VSIFLSLSALSGQLWNAAGQTSAFTYQGRLNDGAGPACGSYDLTFALSTAPSGDAQPIAIVTNTATMVSNGVFTALLDFGPGVFNGSDYWIEIAVRTNGITGPFTVLSPRQPITPAPYALLAANALTANTAASAASVLATNITGTLADMLLSTNVALLSSNAPFAGTVTASNFAGNGAGLTNVTGALPWQVVPGTNQQALANTGYLATNDAQVTIALPLSTNPGDIVRVAGTGAGGWKIAQTNNPSQAQLIKTFGGGFQRTTSWTSHGPSMSWLSLASSSDATKVVAASVGSIYTSADSGTTWAFRTNIAGGSVYVASSADGTKLVGVGSGPVVTSADSGATWTSQTGPGLTWRGVASSSDGIKLVAVPSSGQIYTSPDSGVDWIARNPYLSWYSVASSSDGTKLVAASSGGVYTSTNSGANWTFRTNQVFFGAGFGGPTVASSADGTKLVGMPQNGPIYTSVDSGATWIAQNSGIRGWSSVACSADGARLIATASNGQIYLSLDSGASWTTQNSGIRTWTASNESSDGTKFMAGVSSGFIYTAQLTAVSATTAGSAGYLQGGQNTAIELQYIGNGQFLLLSHEGPLQAY